MEEFQLIHGEISIAIQVHNAKPIFYGRVASFVLFHMKEGVKNWLEQQQGVEIAKKIPNEKYNILVRKWSIIIVYKADITTNLFRKNEVNKLVVGKHVIDRLSGSHCALEYPVESSGTYACCILCKMQIW